MDPTGGGTGRRATGEGGQDVNRDQVPAATDLDLGPPPHGRLGRMPRRAEPSVASLK